jgi:Fe-Mn family superoxide dismutase
LKGFELTGFKGIVQVLSNYRRFMAFELPKLPYATNALEPVVDTETMEIHHGRHHAAYVTNLNKALEGQPTFAALKLEELLAKLSEVPEAIRVAVRNNGGGHANHSMFWEIMTPNKGTKPSSELASAITAAFGSMDDFKTKFNDAGVKQFGSGWVFLIKSKSGALEVVSKPNQDTPLMEGITPIMGNDVWEHAYYLKHKNKRPDYLAGWWEVVNWDAVSARFASLK